MSPAAASVRIIGADGKDVAVVRPDMKVTVQVQLAGAPPYPGSVEVTVTTDKETRVITVDKMPGTGEGNPTYTTGEIQLGYGVADGYGLGKGPLGSIEIGNGGGVAIQSGGGGAVVTWYPDDLQEGLGQCESFARDMEAYLNSILASLAGEPDDEDVRRIREIAKQKLELIKYMRQLFAHPDRWPRQNLYAGQAIIGFLNTPGMLDLREAYPAINRASDQGKQEGKDIVMSAFGELLIAGYAQFANATGAAQMWTLVFGQDIYGKDVGKWERFEAFGDLALQAFMMGAPIHVMNQWRVARTGARIPRTTPRPPEGVKPTGAAVGTQVKAGEFGMQPGAGRHANMVADANGVVIQVRPTSQSAMRWREAGHPGKPMDLKSKTINELDTHLGARDADQGLVGYFEPQRPQRTSRVQSDEHWAQIEQRYADRRQEFQDNAVKMDHLVHEGKIRVENGVVIDTGICGGTGKAITGDYDLWKIAKVDGTPLSAMDKELIVNQLRFGEFGAQHGAHTDWMIDPNAAMYRADPGLLRGHQKVDADIRAKHNIGGEAVVEFGGRSRVPVAQYENGPQPGSTWRPERAARTATPGGSGVPVRPLAAVAALVFVAGVGWAVLGRGGEAVQQVASGGGAASPAAALPATTTRPAAAAPRDPRPQPMVAVFNQASFSTRYSVAIDNPDSQVLTLKWTGPNCGTWDNQAEHRSPANAPASLVDTMIWSHPHPPCSPTTNHADVTVTLSIGHQGGTLVCVFNGSESGNGPECRKP